MALPPADLDVDVPAIASELPAELAGAPIGRGTTPAPAPVVGGEPAPAGAWDDAVALFALDQLSCTGTLIAPNLVLTAGHCRAALDYAVIGAPDPATGGERIAIVEAIAHPDPFTTFDVALLTLEHDASVAPRRLALDCVIAGFLRPGAEVAIVGFGATDPWADEWPGTLHQAFATVVDPECTDFDGGCNEAVSPGGELVAGGDGIDSCLGDSGGPLYLRTDQPFDGETEFLAGVTSRATVPADTPCGGGGIYVRADAVAAWVEETAGVTLPRPTCAGFNTPPAPTAPPIEVVQGGAAVTVVAPGDPDAGQSFTFRLVEGPAFGRAQLTDDGGLFYLAPAALPAHEQRAVVEVTDDGDPPRAGTVSIPIRVVAGEARPGGCDAGGVGAGGVGAGWSGALAALGSLWIGRRSRSR